jgi:phosphomevalonate kinase
MSEADAPGKLMIAGEYAVLQGAPAIAVAVGVRARARVARMPETSSLTVPDSGTWTFQWQTNGRPLWQQVPSAAQGRVLEVVLGALSRGGRLPRVLPPLAIELDTREFRKVRVDGSREKMGLGSSAAITVALVGALRAQFDGASDASELLPIALDAHQQLQNGAGSGIDVMAAVHGGVVAVGAPESPGRTLRLTWPQGLHWLAIWSGDAASTPLMLERFAAFRKTQPVAFSRELSSLSDLAYAVLKAWLDGRAPGILAALDAYGAALRRLDTASGLGIWTPAHERIALLARDAGAIYKVSGAGGGDFGIAFASESARLERLHARLDTEGIHTLSGKDGAVGVAYRTNR